MSLNKQFKIVWDTRAYGGKRTFISANRLGDHIGDKRAEYYRGLIPKLPTNSKKRYSVQGRGFLDVYAF
jgi:hypothetical protein